MFHRSSVPGRKFSTTTSAVAASRRNRSWPSGCAQVERDALAAAALDRPEQRVRPSSSPSTNGPISRMKSPRAGLLDLDDLGALLAEQPGAERRGDARAEVEDPEAGERSRHQARPACSALHRVHAAGACAPRSGRVAVGGVAHELVDHEVVAPALALAHARRRMWLIVALTASRGERRAPSATCSAIARASRRRARRAARPGSRARRARPRRRRASRRRTGTPSPCAARAPTARSAAPRRRPHMRSTGLEKRASSAATIRSHMHASISPAARARALHRGDRDLREVADPHELVPVHDLLVLELALGRRRASRPSAPRPRGSP